MRARILVMPRKEVLDPQGEAVRAGLATLGYDEVVSVRVGRVIELELKGPAAEARARIKSMCDDLLANAVIEDYTFSLESESGVFPTAVVADAPRRRGASTGAPATREAHSEGSGG